MLFNSKASKKRILLSRKSKNNFWKTRIKNSIKKFYLQSSVDSIQRQEKISLISKTQSIVARAAAKKKIHKNKAGRIISKLFRSI